VKVAATSTTWDTPVFTVDTDAGSGVKQWSLAVAGAGGSDNTTLALVDAGGTVTTFYSPPAGIADISRDGEWHFVAFAITQTDSTHVSISVQVDGQIATATGQAFVLGRVTGAWIGPNGSTVITNVSKFQMSALATWGDYSTARLTTLYNAGLGNAGETVAARLARICTEDGITYATLGFYDHGPLCGPQPSGGWLDLIQATRMVEGGWVYDGGADGVQYMAPSQRYDQFSQFTIDGTATSNEIQPPFAPVPDDQGRVNQQSVTRLNGSSFTYTDTTSYLRVARVGLYAGQPMTINLQSDSDVEPRARWEVHQGTVFGPRWPSVTVNVRTIPSRAAAIAALTPGLAFTVKTPTAYRPTYPSDDLLLVIEGYSVTISRYRWIITFNTRLADPWRVWKISDTDLGRLATDGHTTSGTVAAGGTSATFITPADKQPWTTLAGDYPLWVNIAGIRVKVTAMSGTSSPQTATLDGTTVTKSLPSGSAVTIWKGGVIKL